MGEPVLLQIDRLPVAEIEANDRLRPVSEAGVQSLIASIHELGVMQSPVQVRKRKDGRFVLIAGAHRLEAARRLGWNDVPVRVYANATDDWCRLMEVDDNIAGGELSPLDTAVFLARRKEVYERLHPETRRGVAGATRRWDATDTMSVAFVRSTAEKFSLSERHVFRLVAAGEKLNPDEANRLRTAPRQIRLADLMQIARIGQPTERYDVVDALAEGRAKSAAEARKAWAAKERGVELPEKDPVEEAFIALRKVWARAPMAARRRFVAQAFADLSPLVVDEAEGRDEQAIEDIRRGMAAQ